MGRFDGRTEEPTPRARRRARREGRVPRTPEVGVALSLLGAAIAARGLLPAAGRELALGTRELLRISALEPPPGHVRGVVLDMVGGALLPILGLAVALGVVGGVAQTGFLLSPGALAPKLSRLSPRQGLERLRPSALAWEAARSALKVGLLVAVVWRPVRDAVEEATAVRSLPEWLGLLGRGAWAVLGRVALLALFIAAADYVVARVRTERAQRMTRQELKQEHKEMEGDPLVRMHRRRRHRELSRNRMLVEVTTADVVVTNPTHLAVALRYTPGEPAPRVVAKGAGRFALKLRRLAAMHGVMIREDPPLARELYRRCRVGRFVPPALYEAVAVVIAIAYRRRWRGVM